MSTPKKPAPFDLRKALRANDSDLKRLREIDQQMQAISEEAQVERIRLSRKYGLRPGDQILLASGLIVRNEPDAMVPAAPKVGD